MLQQRDRLPIRPMKIIQHHTQRHRPRHRAQQLRHRLKQKKPLRLRIRRLRPRNIRNTPRKVAREPADLTAESLHITREHASGACSTSCEHTAIHGSYGTARSSLHAPQQTANPSAFAPNAANDANRVFPIPGSPDNNTTRRAPDRASLRASSSSPRSTSRPTYATRGTPRSASGNGHPPTRHQPVRPTAPTRR